MKLLIVDFLDSYSHNIPSFLRRACPDGTHLDIHIKPFNSLSKDDVESVAASYHGVILSAGPGTVDCADDLGEFTPALLSCRPGIPIYGICLGFQAICRHFGGTIRRLSFPHHGLVSDILSPKGSPLGRTATRYHSLEVQLGESARRELDVLAVAKNHDGYGDSIMEVRHRTLPYWGVQYHPESVYSSGCEVTVQPFLHAAKARHLNPEAHGASAVNTDATVHEYSGSPEPTYAHVAWKSVVHQTDLLEMLPKIQRGSKDFVLLDSSSKGEWDILAAANTAYLFRYSVRERRMSFKPLQPNMKDQSNESVQVDRSASLQDAWSFLSNHTARRKYIQGPAGVPFWGGFIGYFGYELGLAELGLDAYKAQPNRIPEYGDIQLLWSTETLVYHKKTKTLYAISLNQDLSWIETALRHVESCEPDYRQDTSVPWMHQYKIDHPSGSSYVEKIKKCQDEIQAGNSYEICLTATSTTRKLSTRSVDASSNGAGKAPSSAQRFRHLRAVTPARFMSLMNLGGLEALSASPEEFLSFDARNRTARMKPIKGTLPKTDGRSNPIGLEAARNKLHEPKVIAENLMIVDLVRHDLSQVSDQVTCPDLMHVEDIGPMYQLISTVKAEVRSSCTAWDLIRRSMPPGSMTGAPKRRSCEILQRLEEGYRGLYSGITGYIDVRGHCRTSVNIRNMVKYPGESRWRVGAGGAITNLSDPVDEWNERQLKASSICRSLVPSFSILETILWEPKASRLLYWDEHIRRLLKTVQYFGFDLPFVNLEHSCTSEAAGLLPNSKIWRAFKRDTQTSRDNEVDANSKSAKEAATPSSALTINLPDDTPAVHAWISARLSDWIQACLAGAKQQEKRLRLSLELDVFGFPTLTAQTVTPSPDAHTVNIWLARHAIPAAERDVFIAHKTTARAHYALAREQAGAQGRDEILLFRPDQQQQQREGTFDAANAISGSEDDWLTEGSYTNVAFWDAAVGRWRTPSSGCLPGIMRERLLKSGEIILGDIQRRDLAVGMRLRLFNSVRGVFEGVIKG